MIKVNITLWFCLLDINECDESSSDCDQICTNTPGAFTCSCHSGYTLTDGNCIEGECI